MRLSQAPLAATFLAKNGSPACQASFGTFFALSLARLWLRGGGGLRLNEMRTMIHGTTTQDVRFSDRSESQEAKRRRTIAFASAFDAQVRQPMQHDLSNLTELPPELTLESLSVETPL